MSQLDFLNSGILFRSFKCTFVIYPTVVIFFLISLVHSGLFDVLGTWDRYWVPGSPPHLGLSDSILMQASGTMI